MKCWLKKDEQRMYDALSRVSVVSIGMIAALLESSNGGGLHILHLRLLCGVMRHVEYLT